jgi:hypothetical protein
VLSDPIGSNQKGRAQQTPPAGAGSARDLAQPPGAGQEIRWVGAQHLIRGYCGRAVVVGNAEIAASDREAAAKEQTGARAYSARTVALLQRPRHLVVRIGPRAAAVEEESRAAA